MSRTVPTVGGMAIITFQCMSGDHGSACPNPLFCSCECHWREQDPIKYAAAEQREIGLRFIREKVWEVRARWGLPVIWDKDWDPSEYQYAVPDDED